LGQKNAIVPAMPILKTALPGAETNAKRIAKKYIPPVQMNTQFANINVPMIQPVCWAVLI